MKELIDRFWKKTEMIPFHDCWEWTGSFKRGYGLLNYRYESIYAHRVSWKIHFGEIKRHQWVLQKCMTKSCVNPSHLFLADRSNAFMGRNYYVSKTHCKRGHEFKSENMKTKRQRRECILCNRIRRMEYYYRKQAAKKVRLNGQINSVRNA